MNRQLLFAITLVLAVVLGFVFLGNHPAAEAQKPDKAQQWEYKIYQPTDADFATNKAEGEFNKLATEGWEFVETIVSRRRQKEGFAPVDISCVLFRRLKK